MSLPETHKVIEIDQAGGYDQMHLRSKPLPSVAADHVLVRVAAFGVNYADCCIRFGLYKSQKIYAPFPMTPGFEFSGCVLLARPSFFYWRIA